MAGEEEYAGLGRGEDGEHRAHAEEGEAVRLARVHQVGVAAGEGAELVRVWAGPEAGGGGGVGDGGVGGGGGDWGGGGPPGVGEGEIDGGWHVLHLPILPCAI